MLISIVYHQMVRDILFIELRYKLWFSRRIERIRCLSISSLKRQSQYNSYESSLLTTDLETHFLDFTPFYIVNDTNTFFLLILYWSPCQKIYVYATWLLKKKVFIFIESLHTMCFIFNFTDYFLEVFSLKK